MVYLFKKKKNWYQGNKQERERLIREEKNCGNLRESECDRREFWSSYDRDPERGMGATWKETPMRY